MTIDSERLRTIIETEKFLEQLAYRGLNGIWEFKKLAEIRKMARCLLRHFPENWWVESMGDLLSKKKGRSNAKR